MSDRETADFADRDESKSPSSVGRAGRPPKIAASDASAFALDPAQHDPSRAHCEPTPLDPFELPDGFEATAIGAYLRRQRILRGVTIEELCAETRIPLRSLERLERGEFDGETDGFVRGFVRTVALALGLDPDDTIARMLREPAVGVWERRPSSRRLKQAVALAVLAIAVLVAFLIVQAGWRVLVGGGAAELEREVVLWRDPVRALAEATGVEVDPAGEIGPRAAPGAAETADSAR